MTRPWDYDPESYWEMRGLTYPLEAHAHVYPNFPGREEVKQLLDELKPKSLLDLGCGSGRLFDLYLGIPRVLAVDGSSTMLAHARKRAEELKLSNIEVKQLKAQNIGELGEEIDLVLTRNVLMHVKPDDIVQVVHAIKKVARSSVLLVEYASNPTRGVYLSPHNFVYDYPGLFSDWTCKVQKDVEGDTLFLFRRN